MHGSETATTQPIGHAIVVGAWVVAGLLAILSGIGVLVTSGVGGAVAQVPVEVTTSATFGGVRPCADDGGTLDTGECRPPDGWPVDVNIISMPFDGLELDTVDDPWWTLALARSPAWLGLVAGGAVALLLVPVLRTTAGGRPFAPGNARRLGTATGVVAAAWCAGTLGTYVAAQLVITRLEQRQPPFGFGEGWVSADLRTAWWPLLLVAMLGTLAAAVRRGAVLAEETEGLV